MKSKPWQRQSLTVMLTPWQWSINLDFVIEQVGKAYNNNNVIIYLPQSQIKIIMYNYVYVYLSNL